jgi:hypothetical protein
MLKKNKNTIHPLCARCIKTCKQTVSVQLLTCPLFEPKMSDAEFVRLLDEMEEIGRKADTLHSRVSKLIEEMRVEADARNPEPAGPALPENGAP